MESSERERALEGLFANDAQNYGEKYTEHLLQMYQLYVQTADKVSERRSFANSFFLSLNSFLLAVIGVVPQLRQDLGGITSVWVIVTSIAGIVFCYTWIRLIKSYAKLNEAKFTVIAELEKKLPVSIFTTEWEFLVPKPKETDDSIPRMKYFPLSLVETRVPKTCIALYAILAAVGIWLLHIKF